MQFVLDNVISICYHVNSSFQTVVTAQSFPRDGLSEEMERSVITKTPLRKRKVAMANAMVQNQESEAEILNNLKKDAAKLGGRAYLVLEGDWGGQIYLTIPWELVGPNAKVSELLRKMDEASWGCNNGDGASFSICPFDSDGVFGGMGGGQMTDSLWLHSDFVNRRKRIPHHPTDQLLERTQWFALVARLLDMAPAKL